MKKLVLSSCAGLLGLGISMSAHAAAAPMPMSMDYFSGAFVGINTGYENPNDTMKLDADQIKLHGGTGLWDLGAFAGYGQVLSSSWYLGGNVFYRTNFSQSSLGNFSDSDDVPPSTVKVRTTAKNTYGIEFTPGYVISPRVMANLILGVESTAFKLKLKDSADGTVSKSSREWGWFPGLGINYAITQNFQVGASYTYHWYNSFSKTFTADNESNKVQLYPQRSLFMVNLTYRFA